MTALALLEAIADDLQEYADGCGASYLKEQTIRIRTIASSLEGQAGAVRVTDEMVERACKRYAFREDGAVFPDAYSEYEVIAERRLMREFLEHTIARTAQSEDKPA